MTRPLSKRLFTLAEAATYLGPVYLDGQMIDLHGVSIEQWYSKLLRNALEHKYSGRPCWNQLVAKV